MSREEYAGLEQYCKAKKIRIQDEMTEEGPAYDMGSDISEISRDSDVESRPVEKNKQSSLPNNPDESSSGKSYYHFFLDIY